MAEVEDGGVVELPAKIAKLDASGDFLIITDEWGNRRIVSEVNGEITVWPT